jgi:hypothetical protein
VLRGGARRGRPEEELTAAVAHEREHEGREPPEDPEAANQRLIRQLRGSGPDSRT